MKAITEINCENMCLKPEDLSQIVQNALTPCNMIHTFNAWKFLSSETHKSCRFIQWDDLSRVCNCSSIFKKTKIDFQLSAPAQKGDNHTFKLNAPNIINTLYLKTDHNDRGLGYFESFFSEWNNFHIYQIFHNEDNFTQSETWGAQNCLCSGS